MAKFDSIIKFTGNLDGMVGMKGANGQTYIRKNVKPSDPKTMAQIGTRTKVSLAGQLSKLTPKEAIIGMGGSTRERRNNFMKSILRNATVDPRPGVSVAMLPPDQLTFSTGRDFPVKVTLVPITGVARGIRAELSAEEQSRLEDAGVLSMMLIFVWSDGEDTYRYIDVKTATTSKMSTGVTSLNLNSKCNVYVIPLLPVDGTSRAAYEEGIQRISGDNGYSAIADLSMKGAIALGQSRFSGVGIISES